MRSKSKSPVETPGFYVGIEPGSIFIGGGLYMPTGDQIKAIRKSMVDHPEEFLAMVNERKFKKGLGGIIGEKLQKAPLGYPKDHPMIEHLRHKQFFAGKEFKDESICLKPNFLKTVVQVYSDTLPLIRWLNSALK